MIASREYVLSVLERNNLKPNRNLGQNFFINGELLNTLLANIPLVGKRVLEIGPGLGALTEVLLSRGAIVTAVEKDANMVRILSESMHMPQLTVIEGDCLRVCKDLMTPPFTAAGNLPYFITTDILEMLLLSGPEQAVLMMQKEAADRFFAKPSEKNYTPLAAVFSLYYSAERLGDISPDNYLPPPNIFSSLLYLKEKEQVPVYEPGELLGFFKECFRMRRKTLVNNLSSYRNIRETLIELGISVSTRGEALSPNQLLSLFERLKAC